MKRRLIRNQMVSDIQSKINLIGILVTKKERDHIKNIDKLIKLIKNKIQRKKQETNLKAQSLTYTLINSINLSQIQNGSKQKIYSNNYNHLGISVGLELSYIQQQT
ncbi:hypothetical protein ABPG72_012234 [Tetrahymena utriculariae]